MLLEAFEEGEGRAFAAANMEDVGTLRVAKLCSSLFEELGNRVNAVVSLAGVFLLLFAKLAVLVIDRMRSAGKRKPRFA